LMDWDTGESVRARVLATKELARESVLQGTRSHRDHTVIDL